MSSTAACGQSESLWHIGFACQVVWVSLHLVICAEMSDAAFPWLMQLNSCK